DAPQQFRVSEERSRAMTDVVVGVAPVAAMEAEDVVGLDAHPLAEGVAVEVSPHRRSGIVVADAVREARGAGLAFGAAQHLRGSDRAVEVHAALASAMLQRS